MMKLYLIAAAVLVLAAAASPLVLLSEEFDEFEGAVRVPASLVTRGRAAVLALAAECAAGVVVSDVAVLRTADRIEWEEDAATATHFFGVAGSDSRRLDCGGATAEDVCVLPPCRSVNRASFDSARLRIRLDLDLDTLGDEGGATVVESDFTLQLERDHTPFDGRTLRPTFAENVESGAEWDVDWDRGVATYEYSFGVDAEGNGFAALLDGGVTLRSIAANYFPNVLHVLQCVDEQAAYALADDDDDADNSALLLSSSDDDDDDDNAVSPLPEHRESRRERRHRHKAARHSGRGAEEEEEEEEEAEVYAENLRVFFEGAEEEHRHHHDGDDDDDDTERSDSDDDDDDDDGEHRLRASIGEAEAARPSFAYGLDLVLARSHYVAYDFETDRNQYELPPNADDRKPVVSFYYASLSDAVADRNALAARFEIEGKLNHPATRAAVFAIAEQVDACFAAAAAEEEEAEEEEEEEGPGPVGK